MKQKKREKRIGKYNVLFLGNYSQEGKFKKPTVSTITIFPHGEKRALKQELFSTHIEGERKYFYLNNEDEIKKFIN